MVTASSAFEPVVAGLRSLLFTQILESACQVPPTHTHTRDVLIETALNIRWQNRNLGIDPRPEGWRVAEKDPALSAASLPPKFPLRAPQDRGARGGGGSGRFSAHQGRSSQGSRRSLGANSAAQAGGSAPPAQLRSRPPQVCPVPTLTCFWASKTLSPLLSVSSWVYAFGFSSLYCAGSGVECQEGECGHL